MLTRLRVTGFKNLVDLDLYFGPFTCVAGVNGVGKSNLFDAIQFLSALAGSSLVEAAQSVRADGRRATEIESLFSRAGTEAAPEMSFEAEMIVPREATDDLGQEGRASISFLSYSLRLGKRRDGALSHLGPLEILREELTHINLGEAHAHLPFPHRASTWRKTAVAGSRRAPFFISTEGEGAGRIIQVHQDGGGGGRPRSIAAPSLPRTVLSASNAAENPTALAAKREMQSWSLLQLEPSNLREPDDFRAPTSLATNGSHLAATLSRLAGTGQDSGANRKLGRKPGLSREQVYGRVATRLSDLVEDVGNIWVDADEKRELLTLMVSSRGSTAHAARALSGGTLRFLALAVLEIDPRAQGLLCLEEPENGIHPARIPAMLRLLQDIPTDVEQEIGDDNPLRQVIINTHSAAVVSEVPESSLLVAEPREVVINGHAVQGAAFSCLPNTWRAKLPGGQIVSRAHLLGYLNPLSRPDPTAGSRRVMDRDDIQPPLPY